MFDPMGTLVAADLTDVRDLANWDSVKALLTQALDVGGMTVIGDWGHAFEPHGHTWVWILAESHMAVHTYPEHDYMALDVFTCGKEGDPLAVVNMVARLLSATVSVSSIDRGIHKHAPA